MLQKFTLGGLLAADIAVLLENLPGVPEKAIKVSGCYRTQTPHEIFKHFCTYSYFTG